MKVGAPVEYVTNSNTADGLTNGAPGAVRGFKRINPQRAPYIVWVEFDDPTVGSMTRRAYSQTECLGVDPAWTPVMWVASTFPLQQNLNHMVTRRQVPLRLAAAKTPFTCQGKTMKQVAVDLQGRRLHGSHYTALSRVTKLSDLYVLNLSPEKLHVDDAVREELNRLRNEAALTLCIRPLREEKSSGLFAISHNAQSAVRHLPDIQADPDFLVTLQDFNVHGANTTHGTF